MGFPAALQLPDQPQKCQLTLRRQGGFRFVEQIDPAAPEAVLKQGEEGLAVRLGVQRAASISAQDPRVFPGQFINIGSEIVECLRSQEKAVGNLWHPGEADIFLQHRAGSLAPDQVVPAAAFRTKTADTGDRLQQGGFARAIAPDEKGDRPRDRNARYANESRDIEGIGARLPVIV